MDGNSLLEFACYYDYDYIYILFGGPSKSLRGEPRCVLTCRIQSDECVALLLLVVRRR